MSTELAALRAELRDARARDAEGKLVICAARTSPDRVWCSRPTPEDLAAAPTGWGNPVAVPERSPGLTAEDLEDWSARCRPVTLGTRL